MYHSISRTFLCLALAVPMVPLAAASAVTTSSAAPTATATSAAAQAARPTLHVAKSGKNAAPGTSQRPLKTIGAAVAKASPGQRIEVHSGTYHESVEINQDKAGITIAAARGATVWMDGASRVSGFQRSGGDWVRPGWRAQFDHSPTYTFGQPDNSGEYWAFINRSHPMAAHPDQVWVGGAAQRQVQSAAAVRPGTFFVDDGGDRLVLGTDPGGRAVEASTLIRALEIRATGVTIDGINVRRYAPSVPHMGAVTAERDGIRISRSKIVQNATTGLHAMARGIVLDRVTVAGNGMMGLSVNGADSLRINRLRAIGNNTERFNHAPASGGAKITRSTGIRVTRSLFRDNHGTGIWFDESVYRARVSRSRMISNDNHGLRFEISGNVIAAGNLIVGNRADGINVNNTDHVQLWNNTLVGNTRPINIVQDTRDVDPAGSYRDPSLPLTWRNSPVQIRNNIFSGSRRTTGCLLCVEDYSRRWSGAEMRITARGNLYHRRSGSGIAYWPAARGATVTFADVRAFRRATGQEAPGRAVSKSPVSGDRYVARARTRKLARSIAVPIPSDIARMLGKGGRYAGARYQLGAR